MVVAVLGTSVTLGNPEPLSLLRKHVADIVAQVFRREIEIFHIATSLHTEHLVGLADINHQRRRHQVSAKRNLRRLMTVLIEHILQQAGIEHDVAMIAHEEVFLLRIELLHTVVGKCSHRTRYHLFVDAAHHLKLEVLDGTE